MKRYDFLREFIVFTSGLSFFLGWLRFSISGFVNSELSKKERKEGIQVRKIMLEW
jgi:hypothetical protein